MKMDKVVVGSGVKIHYATRHHKTGNIDGTLCGAGNIAYSMRTRPRLVNVTAHGYEVDCKHCIKMKNLEQR